MADLVLTSASVVTSAPSSTTTVGDLVEQVRRLLNLNDRRNKLAEPLDSSETDVTVEFGLGALQEGVRLSVDAEDMHVWSVNSGTKTATVERGEYGTAAAAHDDDSLVYVNPLASPADIIRAFNETLAELPSPENNVYQVKTDTFTYSAAAQGYDLVDDVVGVLSVAYDLGDSSQVWPTLARRAWRFNPNADTTDFPSGRSLTMLEGGWPGRTVRVTYKAPFGTLGALDDNVVAVAGLQARAHHILKYGAAMRLTAGGPVRRAGITAQGDTRRAEEVSTSDVLRAPARIDAMYAQAIKAEAAELKRLYGL